MGIEVYVSVCVQLYCVGFHCLSLHVSAYMAIFKCVGYCFAAFFLRGHTLRVFYLCFVPVLCCRQTHKQENTKKTRRKTAEEQETNGKQAECDHEKKGSEPKRQGSRILKYIKINI
jgi:hypothetical protein